jgi:hypothetical protein
MVRDASGRILFDHRAFTFVGHRNRIGRFFARRPWLWLRVAGGKVRIPADPLLEKRDSRISEWRRWFNARWMPEGDFAHLARLIIYRMGAGGTCAVGVLDLQEY